MLALGGAWIGCGPQPGAQHLPILTSTLTAIDSAEAVFLAAPLSSAEPAYARVDSAVRAVEERMVGLIVNPQQGKPFTVLDERRRMLRRQPGRHRRIEQEIERTRNQIGHLIETIVDRAKLDAEGTIIDAAYLEQAVADEMRIATHLLEEIDIALEFLARGTRDLNGVISRADSASRAFATIPAKP
jgi:transposase